MIYLHVFLFNITAAVRGSQRSIVNVSVYTAVFLWYLICRLLKAHSLNKKEFALDKARYVSLALVLLISVGLYFFLKSLSTAPEPEPTEEKSVEYKEAVSEIIDGTYSASAFGYEGQITVEIIVKNGEVTDVYFSSYEDDEEYKAYSDELLGEIKADPLGKADTVSGATFSTRGVIKAYEEALAKAGIEKQ